MTHEKRSAHLPLDGQLSACLQCWCARWVRHLPARPRTPSRSWCFPGWQQGSSYSSAWRKRRYHCGFRIGCLSDARMLVRYLPVVGVRRLSGEDSAEGSRSGCIRPSDASAGGEDQEGVEGKREDEVGHGERHRERTTDECIQVHGASVAYHGHTPSKSSPSIDRRSPV